MNQWIRAGIVSVLLCCAAAACGDGDNADITIPGGGNTPIPTATQHSATHTPTAIVPTPTATATPGEEFCGNGVVDGDEQCDGADLDDYTCYDLCDQEDEGGTLRCKSDCTFDFSGCPDPGSCEAF